MKKLITIFTLTLLSAFALPVSAQIVIQEFNYMNEIGSILEQSIDSSVTNVEYEALTDGTGNLMFDFSNFDFSLMSIRTVVDPSNAPMNDSFPNANLVYLDVATDFVEDSIWSFFLTTSDSITELGEVVSFSNSGYIVNRGSEVSSDNFGLLDSELQFPIEYDNQQYSYKYTVDSSDTSFGGVIFESYDTSFYHVDGYGESIYNSVAVPCLRVSYTNKHTSYLTIGGVQQSSFTTISEGAVFLDDQSFILGFVMKVQFGNETFYAAMATNNLMKIPTDIKELDMNQLPDGYTLSQNYPNPFNPSTEIQFSIPTSSDVQLEIYNVQGRLTNVLVNQTMSAGTYTVDWNSTNINGQSVASGIYFYRLSAGDIVSTKKMLLLK